MARQSRLFVVAVVIGILGVVAASLVLRERMRCAGFGGAAVIAEELPAGPPALGTLRIASWNLRNFPLDERVQTADLGFSRRTNICDLETALGGLDADLMGLQEICDTRRFPPIFRRATAGRRMRLLLSSGGGRFGQHLGIAWDDDSLELVGGPYEITEVVLDDGMRPAFAVSLRSRRPGGVEFTFVVVHLEAGADGFADRRRQSRALAAWVDRWVEEAGTPNVIVVGDFNSTGTAAGGEDSELQSMDAILGRAGLHRLPNVTGCSEYWEGGGEPDGVQVASLIDHVYLRGFSPEAVTSELRAWLHCARFGCSDLVSRLGEEDGTFWDVSDHCPLTFELRDTELEGQN
ncbi:MAG: hypothetical protein P8Y93_13415 [Acidobacteriota bacterium]